MKSDVADLGAISHFTLISTSKLSIMMIILIKKKKSLINVAK